MLDINKEYLIDEKGNKKAVVISISDWNKILEKLEEIDDKSSIANEPTPFEMSIYEMRQKS